MLIEKLTSIEKGRSVLLNVGPLGLCLWLAMPGLADPVMLRSNRLGVTSLRNTVSARGSESACFFSRRQHVDLHVTMSV